MAERFHVRPTQGLGFEASDDHLTIGSPARTQASKTLSPVRGPPPKCGWDPQLPRTSLVQAHGPKHVLRLRPRAMNAVVEHVHLRIVEGVASVFGLTQLHRAKVKILPSPPTQTAQNRAGPGPGDRFPARTPSTRPPPSSRWLSRQKAKLAPHVAGVHVQRDVQILRLERRPKPQVHPARRRPNHPSKEHVEALGSGTRVGVGHVFLVRGATPVWAMNARWNPASIGLMPAGPSPPGACS